MRTTLDLDEQVLAVARRLAKERRQTMGQVIGDLVRQALRPTKAPKVRNGFPLLEVRRVAKRPDLELVNRLRDEG